ncbi:MAG: helix-turn-helix domain-containing protein [Saprospiraceae bacterium]|nr:helix-turn-helix domain-containing protein [Saprospiraceae bacterium]
MAKSLQDRIVFGLKVRQHRQVRGWNFEEFHQKTGISISYLNEIEKGKKYPQAENLQKLAQAFEIPAEQLTSRELTHQLAPLGDLLRSNFLSELPLDLFGIEIQQVVEIIARAPDRVNAFISAILEIARLYALRNENFFLAALRAYQELHLNYFEDLEEAAEQFVQRHKLPENGGVSDRLLADLLQEEYDYTIDHKGLARYPELEGLRALYQPGKKRLLLNPNLNPRQRAFQLAKELGFQALQLKERPLSSSLVRAESFEKVLNNFKAGYFAVALLVGRRAFRRDLQQFLGQTRWNPLILKEMMEKYQVSPEVLFQRFNLLTREFDLQKTFFLRIVHRLERNAFDIDKELHLNRRHEPHASGLNEHYCRRWVGIRLLQELAATPAKGPMISGIQRAVFLNTGDEYLCFSVAKSGMPSPDRNASVTLGIQLDDDSRARIRFWNDPAIPVITVNVACERCALSDCAERAAPPIALERRDQRRRVAELIKKLTEK